MKIYLNNMIIFYISKMIEFLYLGFFYNIIVKNLNYMYFFM